MLTGIPDRLATTTFHRPQIYYYYLSYFIDFRQLRFGLQMKVNAGGCTHRDKLDVVSKYKFLPSLHINSCMHMRACIARGLSGTPVHVDIHIVTGETSSLPRYLLACACAHLPTRRHLVCISTSNLVYLAILLLLRLLTAVAVFSLDYSSCFSLSSLAV